MELDRDFWDKRYLNEDTPWALQSLNPALINYIADKDKASSILIPGAGTSLEAIELLKRGFVNITVCDISPSAIMWLKQKIHQIFGDEKEHQIHFVLGDFFEMDGQYDYIIEQTFFCALPIELRTQYVDKMYRLLKENGTLFGVLFGVHFDKDGPPFGGSELEYKSLFSNKFYIKEISICTSSVKPRAGSELFFICKKNVKPKIL